MKPEQFLKKSDEFRGTAYFCFELNEKLMCIGRMTEDGPVELYERNREAERDGGRRESLATFESEDAAARSGAFIASMGEMIS